ncbi:MAG: phospho-sugar mutase [Clostridiales bacterium]|nr:phospho-sugar mutase [Clostridiales bacterium]MBS5877475.1 phospho-sugar mutase [Clostridiales bacterium]
MSEYMEKYKEWLANPYFAEEDKAELRAIEGNEAEIEDRFYKDLEFGTGGLRGVLGMGTNRINIYTIRKATQGLSNFINKKGGADRGVAIAYDSRRHSAQLAHEAASCLNANGIRSYIFSTLTPTPELSFAVRELGAIAGIVITASHNPPEYNGYKVYWEDGAQITAPIDHDIIAEVNKVTDFNDVMTMPEGEARIKDLYHVIGYEMDDRYIDALRKVSIDDGAITRMAENFKIVYTPFNGTGNVPVRRVLNELGFKNVYVVKEQEDPDPDFTTLEYPNPEDPKAFTLALKLAREKDADIILATDPDADRLGIYAKDEETGEYIPFTGNMSAMIIAEYILSRRREKGVLHEKGAAITEESGLQGALVTTIVSTNMAKAVAAEYNLECIEVLTGFKYIGEQIKFFEQKKDRFYEFGFEESYGCLVGTHARDKDAPVSVMALCEAAAYYKEKGITLCRQMKNIFEKYGYYREDQRSVTMKGAEGAKQIRAVMEKLRSNPPARLGRWEVLEIRDYKNDRSFNMRTGETGSTGLPSSNVLYFALDNDAWCCARPSGTEPKIKFYMGVKGSSFAEAGEQIEELRSLILNEAGISE